MLLAQGSAHLGSACKALCGQVRQSALDDRRNIGRYVRVDPVEGLQRIGLTKRKRERPVE
jgi:hypothetical protein